MYERDKGYLNKIYLDTLNKYGDSAEAVHWSPETQKNRFKVLTEIGNIENCSVLDFGCGIGHLAAFFREQGINVDYTGVDILDDFLVIAKNKYPEYRFGLLEEFKNERFDYVFISGVFNNKIQDNESYYKHYLKKLYAQVDKGISFNMLSTYANFYDDVLFYEKPENIFRFVKTEISPYVTIRNDYQLREDAPPVDFCVYIYKK